MTILIVEDDNAEGYVLATTLRLQQILPNGSPIQCMVATSCAQADRWLKHQPGQSVEVVVLDRILSAHETGLSLITLLRQSPAVCLTAVVVVRSGHDDPVMIEEARVAGANGFISKRRIDRNGECSVMAVVDAIWRADHHNEPRPWLVLC